VFADAAYQGKPISKATPITVEIVKKPTGQVGFAVHPRRWVVERTFAWLGRNRRLWKDAETTIASAEAFLYAAAVLVLIRRIARGG
jgi:putative transposase